MQDLFTSIDNYLAQEGHYAFRVRLDASHPVYRGHFPGHPVLPGVCTLQLVRECLNRGTGRRFRYAAIRECKFLGMVVPQADELLEIDIRVGDDTQSGFRLYPVRRMKGMRFATRRYEFEVEVLVRAAWRGIEVRNIPVRVFYPEKAERVSHFRPGKDFTRISILNTLLVLGALLFYYPWRFLRSLTRENIRRFVVDNITRSKDSNPRLAASIGLGVFFGIAPLWGYQMIAAAVTAHFTHLNKAVAVISSNISIPPMIPFILYGSYWTGAQVLQRDMPLSLSDITLERVAADLVQYIVGSFTMAAVCGAAATAVGYALLVLCKRTPGHE